MHCSRSHSSGGEAVPIMMVCDRNAIIIMEVRCIAVVRTTTMYVLYYSHA